MIRDIPNTRNYRKWYVYSKAQKERASIPDEVTFLNVFFSTFHLMNNKSMKDAGRWVSYNETALDIYRSNILSTSTPKFGRSKKYRNWYAYCRAQIRRCITQHELAALITYYTLLEPQSNSLVDELSSYIIQDNDTFLDNLRLEEDINIQFLVNSSLDGTRCDCSRCLDEVTCVCCGRMGETKYCKMCQRTGLYD
jgi:hypothetical protein